MTEASEAAETLRGRRSADGNMLTRDGWTQTWNGENRLIQAVKGSAKLQFAYDYMGRRIEKKVYDGESLTKHTRFVYNGYKLVEELDALNNNATVRKYTWQPEIMGLDVPLSVYDAVANTTYFYTTDANKNVSYLTDSTGAVVAHYEYSPFGVQTKASGAYAESNPFRFSSEYFDSETGLIYYNYRYYSPDLGRWLSRDPIEERGGWNLYIFILNQPIYWIDFHGKLPTAVVGAGIGAIAGGIGGAIAGGLKGGWGGAAKGLVSGATGGAIAGGLIGMGVPPVVANAVGGAAAAATGALLDGRVPNLGEAAVGAGLGALGAGVSGSATANIPDICATIASTALEGPIGVYGENVYDGIRKNIDELNNALNSSSETSRAGAWRKYL